jgi:hypothetical protein
MGLASGKGAGQDRQIDALEPVAVASFQASEGQRLGCCCVAEVSVRQRCGGGRGPPFRAFTIKSAAAASLDDHVVRILSCKRHRVAYISAQMSAHRMHLPSCTRPRTLACA